MVQYSHEILNLFGAPELFELTVCGAKGLPTVPNYLPAAIWNHIAGASHPDTAYVTLILPSSGVRMLLLKSIVQDAVIC